VEEMFAGLELLERWVGRASLRQTGEQSCDDAAARAEGRRLLAADSAEVDTLEVLGEQVENTRRKTVILKARQAWGEYRKMIVYYGVKTVMAWLEADPSRTFEATVRRLAAPRVARWVNMGGQLVTEADLDALIGRMPGLGDWNQIHAEYDRLWDRYGEDKTRHALASLLDIEAMAAGDLSAARWRVLLDRAVAIQNEIADRTYQSRAKDYQSHFRTMHFTTPEEMKAVVGTVDDNSFVKQVRREAEAFAARAAALKSAVS